MFYLVKAETSILLDTLGANFAWFWAEILSRFLPKYFYEFDFIEQWTEKHIENVYVKSRISSHSIRCIAGQIDAYVPSRAKVDVLVLLHLLFRSCFLTHRPRSTTISSGLNLIDFGGRTSAFRPSWPQGPTFLWRALFGLTLVAGFRCLYRPPGPQGSWLWSCTIFGWFSLIFLKALVYQRFILRRRMTLQFRWHWFGFIVTERSCPITGRPAEGKSGRVTNTIFVWFFIEKNVLIAEHLSRRR